MTYKLIRSERKTLSLQIGSDGSLLVRSPRRVSAAQIDRFVEAHQNWIEKQQAQIRERQKKHPARSAEEIAAQVKKSYEILLPRVEYFSKLMKVTPVSVRVTKAEKRFGSCSSNKHICFSYRLIEYPENAIDYVVVHELAHIKEMNHSKRFWAIVKEYCPDYKELRKLLTE